MPERATATELERLTGLRSGKSSFYSEFRATAQRLDRVVAALDTISRALVQTVHGSENLVRAVAEAARVHLDAEWVVLALADGALPDAHPRHLILDSAGRAYAFEGLRDAHDPGPHLPDAVLNRLNDILRGQLAQFRLPVIERHHAHVPIELDGEVMGAFAAWTAPPRTLDATDAAVMRILASQTAVALQNSSLFSTSVNLLAESEARNAELLATQRELGAVQRHQVLDNERHRIARELHDSVAQTVLSAGMLIEVCRSEAAAPELAARLDLAKDLTRSATEQLRSAIYALNHPDDADRSSLIEMLAQLATVHMPEDLRVDLRVTGQAGELPGDVEHALLRIAGEALFNTAMHGSASRAIVSLTYGEHAVTLSISDDGVGDPDRLRLTLAVAEAADVDGRHRGLANMRARAREHGGTFEVYRSRLGGVRVAARIPRGGMA
ncbi:MadS family sensor histidine kinase [Mycolicibacterium tokaiense]|jgi:signal transduction histidine kinase|uniref:Histidine kinase n=1 Tax=Mycolicibacterium tokaiense TaxID=39695 RepID=A0A378TEP8_9MYCO|nr:GAF domain-containing sensor histidine kinase [Mycolicibacterium tokaiense]ANW67367.1 histidine kinase [Mycobacterium sp. djl-10]BBY86221.1 histidine kinase [Mycolicibacterium tokaiense]STZ59268.1 histidine kinase [Mycolicibacterium tokaiense]